MKLNIVITMAGAGSRFKKKGYQLPKFQIEAHGKTLFEWSMISLKNMINDEAKVIFVCLKSHNCVPFIREKCKNLGINNFLIQEINELTDGQATTAYLSRDHWLADNPLLIFNIDTFVYPDALQPECIKPGSDGWIPCFQAPGSHWSFVDINADGWAKRVVEKNKISKFASIGLYWFKNPKDFIACYENSVGSDTTLTANERYIAPLYDRLIEQNKKVSISDISLDKVIVLGTPEELDIFLRMPVPNV